MKVLKDIKLEITKKELLEPISDKEMDALMPDLHTKSPYQIAKEVLEEYGKGGNILDDVEYINIIEWLGDKTK